MTTAKLEEWEDFDIISSHKNMEKPLFCNVQIDFNQIRVKQFLFITYTPHEAHENVS